jgi:hypothetical protein
MIHQNSHRESSNINSSTVNIQVDVVGLGVFMLLDKIDKNSKVEVLFKIVESLLQKSTNLR